MGYYQIILYPVLTVIINVLDNIEHIPILSIVKHIVMATKRKNLKQPQKSCSPKKDSRHEVT